VTDAHPAGRGVAMPRRHQRLGPVAVTSHPVRMMQRPVESCETIARSPTDEYPSPGSFGVPFRSRAVLHRPRPGDRRRDRRARDRRDHRAARPGALRLRRPAARDRVAAVRRRRARHAPPRRKPLRPDPRGRRRRRRRLGLGRRSPPLPVPAGAHHRRRRRGERDARDSAHSFSRPPSRPCSSCRRSPCSSRSCSAAWSPRAAPPNSAAARERPRPPLRRAQPTGASSGAAPRVAVASSSQSIAAASERSRSCGPRLRAK